ncbi:hypothetical protein M8C21_030746 [Ambrosia artemisiifolia]|uniref:Uncharacterized protein n=1 Tax=Ambrosia artemisiifolia TaxID=4212 RepID=A0AAD5GCX9_AMBAR|nr:hypothetical protein M8C21_030746 [Ambrosia artemisiifolia]
MDGAQERPKWEKIHYFRRRFKINELEKLGLEKLKPQSIQGVIFLTWEELLYSTVVCTWEPESITSQL